MPNNISLFQAEQELSERFKGLILIGVDEAGRGPLAGPVVAGAAVGVPAISILNDSKKLTEKQREQIFAELQEHCKYHSIGEASAQEIDNIGILNATFLAMRRALAPIISQLNEKKLPYKILVDGNLHIREMDKDLQMPIIKGDGKVACIAAASILAKVHRDRLMVKFAEQFPNYGFEKHKGYGTKAHLLAIQKFGQCEIHRKSFNSAIILPALEQDFEWIKIIQNEAGLPLWKPNSASWVFGRSAFAIWQVAGDECELLSIAVNAASRGKGYAKALMEHSHKELAKQGLKKFFLEVRENNIAAISLYEKVGYEKIAERKGYYADGECAVVMRTQRCCSPQ